MAPVLVQLPGRVVAVDVDDTISVKELIQNLLPVRCRLITPWPTVCWRDFRTLSKRSLESAVSHARGGGKGGYGNTLRALGRKGGITDNVSDCRDLQGRRLRDVEATKRVAEVAQRKRAREEEEHEARVAKKAAQLATRKDEEQEIKDVIAQSRGCGFQDTAAASVAGGLAKATASSICKDAVPEAKAIKLKAFDVMSDTDSSDEDDTSA